MKENAKVFVAYASRDEDNASAVFEGVRRANALPQPVRFEPWPYNDVAGRTLISPIVEGIEASPYIVADITYFNLNVVYEIGYAIGRQKRVILLRNSKIEGDKALAQKVGIFDTLGYIEFSTSEDVRNILSAHHEQDPLLVTSRLDKKAPVYIIEPAVARHADVLIASRVKKAGFKYRSFNPTEHMRMSATETLRQVATSSGVVTRLQESSVRGSDIHNVRACFAIGLADGMGKPSLTLHPSDVTVPLDLRDAARLYRDPNDIASIVADFCPHVVSYFTEQEPPQFENLSPLSSLSIGDPMAENEMSTLGLYYLPTDQFHRVINGDANMVVGRKGSGKTALFIRVRDKVRSDKRNVVVDLKPEGYQLVKFKEGILRLLSSGARQHLVMAFWEYIILVEVAYKLLEKDKYTYKQDHKIYTEYLELKEFYDRTNEAYEGDFAERLYKFSSLVADRFDDRFRDRNELDLSTIDVSDLLNAGEIPALRQSISRYLDRKTSVWVLFDNLDKGWSIGGVDETDALITRALIDASRKVQREMERDGHRFNNVVFVRNDVYDSVMKNSADFGKEMRTVLDWTDVDLLREMLRLRLAKGLGIEGQAPDFFAIWQQLVVSHVEGEETSAMMIERTLMRPRNLLKVFNHCRGFATNLNKSKIEEGDIRKGLKAYSEDLFTEIARELEDVLPASADVLYELMDTVSQLTSAEIESRIMNLSADRATINEIMRFLVFYGVFGLVADDRIYYIYDVNYDIKRIEVRTRSLGQSAVFQINPALWPALNTRRFVRADDSTMDIETFIAEGSAS